MLTSAQVAFCDASNRRVRPGDKRDGTARWPERKCYLCGAWVLVYDRESPQHRFARWYYLLHRIGENRAC